MTDSLIPRWSVRLDASRPAGSGYADLMSIVNNHYNVHQEVDNYLGPYNARQRNSELSYLPPQKDALKQVVKQCGMNDFSYSAYLNSIVKFCEQHKGLRTMPSPHPSTIHSIQLPLPAFELEDAGNGETLVRLMGTDIPLVVKGLRDQHAVKFIIIRPKLSQLGTASVSKWEVLFYKSAIGYIPDWADSNQNPRYSGVF